MQFKKLLSAVSALAIAASAFAAMAVTASAADTTYTWDFTDSEWFSSTIAKKGYTNSTSIATNAGKGSSIFYTGDSTTISTETSGQNSISYCGKINGASATALVFDIPSEYDSATLTLSLSSSKGAGIVTAITDGTDTINSLKVVKAWEDLSAPVTPGRTYYLDTHNGNIYIKTATLTLTKNEEAPESNKAAFTFDGVTLTGDDYVSVTVNGETKRGKLPFSAQGDANIAIIITDIPDDATVSAVLN